MICSGRTVPQIVVRCGTPRVRVARGMFDRVSHCGVILRISCLVISGNVRRCYYHVSCRGGAYVFLPRVPTCDRLWGGYHPRGSYQATVFLRYDWPLAVSRGEFTLLWAAGARRHLCVMVVDVGGNYIGLALVQVVTHTVRGRERATITALVILAW